MAASEVSALSALPIAAAVLAIALPAAPARAGRDCESRPDSVESVCNGLCLAQRTARAFDASGSQVVVLARAGRDLARWGPR